MEKADLIRILKTDRTVFSFKDILLESGEDNPALLRRRLHHYIKKGELYPIRRGLYAKDKNYDKLEAATRIFTPSYISFETVLAESGMIFQYYKRIFVASYLSREIVCDGQDYSYKKIKDTILTDRAGVEHRGYYTIASKERAFLDIVYLYKNYYMDNLSPLNWEKVFELVPIYRSKAMIKRINEYYKNFKSDQA